MSVANAVVLVSDNSFFESEPGGYADPLVVPAEPGDSPDLAEAKATCAKPSGGLLCVPVGGSNELHITLTCKVKATGKVISCGKVTWKTTIAYMQLRAKFEPDPGPAPKGATVETVDASTTAVPGHYKQELKWTCTGYKGCKGDASLPITILKAT